MIYIHKGFASSDVSKEIQRVKRDSDWDHADHSDSKAARSAFDLLDKSIIRHQLIIEQKGLCAYCMRRIQDDESTTIEHWLPIDADPDGALKYENMMACCDGGRKKDSRPKVLCCDATKGNQVISICPYNKQQMNRIGYRTNGHIFIRSEDIALQNEIDVILHLNGIVNQTGGTEQDTSTRLVYSRRQIYLKYEMYIKQLTKSKKSIETAVRKRISTIQESAVMDEFAGVWLYFLKRRLKRI